MTRSSRSSTSAVGPGRGPVKVRHDPSAYRTRSEPRRSRRATRSRTHRSATPLIAAFGAPRLDHVVIQAELETFAVDAMGRITAKQSGPLLNDADIEKQIGESLAYNRITGNSYAAPHITGVVAKILGKHPGLTVFQTKTLLRALAANVRREPSSSS